MTTKIKFTSRCTQINISGQHSGTSGRNSLHYNLLYLIIFGLPTMDLVLINVVSSQIMGHTIILSHLVVFATLFLIVFSYMNKYNSILINFYIYNVAMSIKIK